LISNLERFIIQQMSGPGKENLQPFIDHLVTTGVEKSFDAEELSQQGEDELAAEISGEAADDLNLAHDLEETPDEDLQ